jgi:hypothetical protein
LALSVPLSRFTSRVGGGSAFYVRQHSPFNFMNDDKLIEQAKRSMIENSMRPQGEIADLQHKYSELEKLIIQMSARIAALEKQNLTPKIK